MATASPARPGIITRLRAFAADPVITAILGAIAPVIVTGIVAQYDAGFIARIFGASPRWSNVDLSDKAEFNANCEYSVQIGIQPAETRVPGVLEPNVPFFFYPTFVSRDGIKLGYDTTTLGMVSDKKGQVDVFYRALDQNGLQTSRIVKIKWDALKLQARCSQ